MGPEHCISYGLFFRLTGGSSSISRAQGCKWPQDFLPAQISMVLGFCQHAPPPPARLPMTCPHWPDTFSCSTFAWAHPLLGMPFHGSMSSTLPQHYRHSGPGNSWLWGFPPLYFWSFLLSPVGHFFLISLSLHKLIPRIGFSDFFFLFFFFF